MSASPDYQVHKLLVCDLDGTLIDSAPDLGLSLNILLQREGRRALSHEEVVSMIGDGATKLVERGFAATGHALSPEELSEMVKAFLAIYGEHLSEGTYLYPHAIETLEALKAEGWRLAICTNKPIDPTRQILENLEIGQLFEGVVGGDSYAVKKPDARHILNLLDELGTRLQDAVMLGDGKNDILAAKNAGLPSVLYTHGYGTEAAKALGPDAIVEDYRHLKDALAHITEQTTAA